ncbi:MAG: hypothetical protein AUJ25_03455 [Parcubacteria group bacterium CG1_02_37_13]|nr:MAG: hypothetical protein AUJ25_03455 [Parcubacteria group bacterium CG1_02_37_13]
MKTFHRLLLEKLLKQNSVLVKGKILDAGSGQRRYDHLFKGEIIACDLNPKPEIKVEKCDLCALPYQNEQFDSVLCLEVLEYLTIDTVKVALKEIKRVLRPGGLVLLSSPFFYKDHQDNLRLSAHYLASLFNEIGFSDVYVSKFGNKFTAYYDMMRYGYFKAKYLKPFYLLELALAMLAIKLFCLENKQDDFYTGIMIKITKKNSECSAN